MIYVTGMAKLLPFARKTCLLETPLSLRALSTGNLLYFRLVNRKGYSTKHDTYNDPKAVSIKEQHSNHEIKTTFVKVKENTKTATYMGVIIAGLGITAIMFFSVLRELFSSKSPNSIYTEALERCRNDPNVQNALGVPIKGFGEETRRGRRRISHIVYNKDGVEHMRMKFYIEGFRKKATVFLEMKEDENGKFVYRYLFVETDDFGRPPIILEDNRFGHVDPPKGKSIVEDTGFIDQLKSEAL